MIDRIEELLSEIAAEDDDEEQQEDVLALAAKEEAVPASPRRGEGETGGGETGDRSGGRTAGEIVLERPGLIAGETRDGAAGDRSGGRTAGEILLERPGLIAGLAEDSGTGNRGGGRTAGEIVMDRPGSAAGEAAEKTRAAEELWKDGPVWTVRSGPTEMDEAQRTALAGRTARVEDTLRPARDGELIWNGRQWAAQGSADLTSEGARRAGPGQSGLEGLYRQTVQGLRPAAPAVPPEQTGKTARAQEPGSAASLAVDELDRAVRRDSRRYDGGMSIY